MVKRPRVPPKSYEQALPMLNNDSMRSIRFILDVSEAEMVEICKTGGAVVPLSEMKCFLLPEEDEKYLPCSDEVMTRFLNGLVTYKRGKDESRPPAPLELPVTNNTVLKKVRVAFELKEDELLRVIGSGGLQISKSELSAFMRSRDHRNYRECGDQLMRNLFRGLAEKLR